MDEERMRELEDRVTELEIRLYRNSRIEDRKEKNYINALSGISKRDEDEKK